MAQQPINTNNDRSLLERGGATGAAVGGLLGGYSNVASGYQTVANLRGKEQSMRHAENTEGRAQQTHEADLSTKYMDLALKSRDLQERNMEIEVLKREQGGKIYNAMTSTELAKDLYKRVGGLKEQQANKLAHDTIASFKALDDQALSTISQYGEGVNTAKEHAQAYAQMERMAQSQNKTVEEMFPGMEREWKGQETKTAYKAAQRISTATAEALKAQRLATYKHGLTLDRDSVQQQYGLENKYVDFMYDAALLQMKEEISRDRAMLSGGDPIKRSDLENETPKAVASSIAVNLVPMLVGDAANVGKVLEKNKKDILVHADQLANEVSKRVDDSWKKYTSGEIPKQQVLTQSVAKMQVLNEFQGRVGIDGKVYPKGNTQLLKQKDGWIRSWMHDLSVQDSEAGDKFRSYSPDAQRAFAEAAWSNVEARRQANKQSKAPRMQNR